MIQIEIKKNIKSKTIPNMILAVLGVCGMYLFLLYSDIFQKSPCADMNKVKLISNGFNADIAYYFIPFVILYLINECFAHDIQTGRLKFIMIKAKKSSIICNKLIFMVLVSAMVLLITNIINFILVPSIAAKGLTFNFFSLSLYLKELIIITLMILCFTPIAMINNMNLIGLLIIHFIFIFIAKVNSFISRIVYSGQLANLLYNEKIEFGIIILEIILLFIFNIIIFERREFTE